MDCSIVDILWPSEARIEKFDIRPAWKKYILLLKINFSSPKNELSEVIKTYINIGAEDWAIPSMSMLWSTSWNLVAMKAAIPVVFGGSSRRDYDLVAPPHSFIHIEDFDDAQTLADYLHYLATNSTAYSEYFW